MEGKQPMAGTVEGGKKAAAKNLARNPNFYREIGAKGGCISRRRSKKAQAEQQTQVAHAAA